MDSRQEKDIIKLLNKNEMLSKALLDGLQLFNDIKNNLLLYKEKLDSLNEILSSEKLTNDQIKIVADRLKTIIHNLVY